MNRRQSSKLNDIRCSVHFFFIGELLIVMKHSREKQLSITSILNIFFTTMFTIELGLQLVRTVWNILLGTTITCCYDLIEMIIIRTSKHCLYKYINVICDCLFRKYLRIRPIEAVFRIHERNNLKFIRKIGNIANIGKPEICVWQFQIDPFIAMCNSV